MPPSIVIRKATDDELGLIRKLSVEELSSELNEKELRHLARAQDVFGKRLEAIMARGGNEFYVAELEEGESFAGYVWFGVSERPFSGEKVGWIYDIMVKEGFRGRGIGEALMRHAMKVSREKGFDEIGLMVNSKNSAASSLYEKLGFRTEYMVMNKTESGSVSSSNT